MKQSGLFEKLKLVPRLMGVAAVVVGAWLAGTGRLRDPAVLLGFFMASVSLWYLPEEETNRRSRAIVLGSALLLITLGVFGLKDTIELKKLLAPMSGVSFLMIGFALIFMHSRRYYWLTRVMISVTVAFSLLTGVSYAYGIRSHYVIGPYLNLAPIFLILSVGLLFAHAEHGFAGIATRDTAGAVMARHLLPAAIVLPFTLGLLMLHAHDGQWLGTYSISFGLSLFVVASVMIFSTLIWWNSKLLDRIDVERHSAEDDLRRAYTQTEQLLSAITSILIGITPEGKVTYWNGVAEAMFSIPSEEVLNKQLSHCGVQLDFMKILDGVKECAAKNRLVHVDDVSFQRPDAQKGYLGFSVIPIQGAEKIRRFLLFGAEITKRKQANQLKDDFVSTVSHELRTPLAITKEGITLILDNIVGPVNPKQADILTTARENIDRLARIIESLLDISRIEAGRVELKKKLIDLTALVAATVRPFEQRIREKGLELKLELPEKEIRVYADPDKITQVVTNLLGNAVKFTRKGSIAVMIREKQEEIECLIRDTGLGLSKEDLPNLFTKFQQFGRISGGGEKGTGLGLAISRGIIELHNGEMSAESILNKGTTFTFTLPKYVHERLLKESVRDGIRLAVKNDSETSLIIGSIADFNALKQRMSLDQVNDILEDVKGILKSSLRQSGDDSFQELGEVAVVLTDCNRQSAEVVRGRLDKVTAEYLSKKALNGSLHLRFGVATYPRDASDDESLIQKAKEDGENSRD